MAWWANPEHTGVIVVINGAPTYLDAGPEYEAAVAAVPLPHTEIPTIPAIPDPRPPVSRAALSAALGITEAQLAAILATAT